MKIAIKRFLSCPANHRLSAVKIIFQLLAVKIASELFTKVMGSEDIAVTLDKVDVSSSISTLLCLPIIHIDP